MTFGTHPLSSSSFPRKREHSLPPVRISIIEQEAAGIERLPWSSARLQEIGQLKGSSFRDAL